jgi:hypothetical protein
MKKPMLKLASLLLLPLCISLATEPAIALNTNAPSTNEVCSSIQAQIEWELNSFAKMVLPSHMEVYLYSALFTAWDTSTVMFLVAKAWGQVVKSTWSSVEGVSLPDYDFANLSAKMQVSAGEYMFTVGIFSTTGGVFFVPKWYHFTVQYQTGRLIPSCFNLSLRRLVEIHPRQDGIWEPPEWATLPCSLRG